MYIFSVKNDLQLFELSMYVFGLYISCFKHHFCSCFFIIYIFYMKTPEPELHQSIWPDMHVSMTSLLMHTVAHFTRLYFRSKTNNQPIKKILGLAVTWVKVVKNCKILTFKVNFLCQKLSESFQIFFFIEEHHFRGMFFVIDIFWKLQLVKYFVY